MPTSEIKGQVLVLYFPNGTSKAYDVTSWEVDPHTRVLKFTPSKGATIWTTLPFETTFVDIVLNLPD